MSEQFIGTKEAAELLNVSQARIRQLIMEKRLKAKKIGNSWLIDTNDLDGVRSRPAGRPWDKAADKSA